MLLPALGRFMVRVPGLTVVPHNLIPPYLSMYLKSKPTYDPEGPVTYALNEIVESGPHVQGPTIDLAPTLGAVTDASNPTSRPAANKVRSRTNFRASARDEYESGAALVASPSLFIMTSGARSKACLDPRRGRARREPPSENQ